MISDWTLKTYQTDTDLQPTLKCRDAIASKKSSIWYKYEYIWKDSKWKIISKMKMMISSMDLPYYLDEAGGAQLEENKVFQNSMMRSQ